MVPESLLDEVRRAFALALDGIHGEGHWARVCENGRRLAGQTGADPVIVELFAYLHDCQRQSDGWDKGHGQRASEFVRGLEPGRLGLPEAETDLLVYAIAHHSEGLTEAEVTVQTCWDADRLDLGRIGVRPKPPLLCTPAAADPSVIEWAWARSRAGA